MQIIKIIIVVLIIVGGHNTYAVDHPLDLENNNPNFLLEQEDLENIKLLDMLYRKFTKIKSRFIQTTNLGDLATGWFIIQKPGKARIEYEDIPIKLIANDGTLLIHNLKDKTKSYLPIKSSPFYYLLQHDFSFLNSNILIINYLKTQDRTEIQFVSRKNPELGHLNLILNPQGEIIKWIITDAKGIITTISLQEPIFSNGLFKNKMIFNTQKIVNIKYVNVE